MLDDESSDDPSNWRKAMEWIMASEKARYWMAVGVAALFLSNSFVGGPSDWALRLADRSTATAQRISSQAIRYAVVAQMIFGRSARGFVEAQNASAHAQTCPGFGQTAMAHAQDTTPHI